MRNLYNRLMPEQREGGASMMFAILVMFVCITISAVIVALALTSTVTTRALNYTMAFQAGTDTAIANALESANVSGETALSSHQGQGNAVTGTTPAANTSYPVKWRWYTTQVARSGAQVEYYVNVDAYTADPAQANARHVQAVFEPLSVASASYDSTKKLVTYNASASAAFQYGLTGTATVALDSNSRVYSYDSNQTQNPASSGNNAAVATSGTFTLGGTGTGLNFFNAMGSSANCTPAANCGSVTTTKYTYNMSLAGVTSAVNAACPNASYPAWTASSGTALANNSCYSSLTFDADTTYTSATRVYVKGGSVTVNAGVKANFQSSPENLVIFAAGGTSVTLNNGSTSAPTYFNGAIAGDGHTCGDTATSAPTSATLYYSGALACTNTKFGPASTIWLDDSARNIVSSGTASTIYGITGYQVRSTVAPNAAN